MKWIKLDGKKEPVFKQKYVLWIPEMELEGKHQEGYWHEGYLKSIEHTEEGKEYAFIDDEDQIIAGASYYAIVEPPKEEKNKNPTTKAGL